jgi:glycosyltransferase involved in cell wall biosynthesis
MKPQQWPHDTSICIPAYKAAETLDRFLPVLLEQVTADKIIIVDDASLDNTDSICRKYGITCIVHPVNQGKGAALRTGFNYLLKAGNISWVFTIDADGQHAVSDIGVFLDYINSHPETAICIGSRQMRIGKMPLLRILSNKITSGLMSLYCKQPILDSQCGYRVYSLSFLSTINIEYNRFEMESEVLLKAAAAGNPIGFVPIQTVYLDGTSHISHFYDTVRWVKAVVSVHSKLKIFHKHKGP